MYRWSELSRKDLWFEVLDKVVEMLADVAEVEKQGELEGRRQTIVLSAK